MMNDTKGAAMTSSRPTPDRWPADSYGLLAAVTTAQAALQDATRARREIAALRIAADAATAARRNAR